MPTKKLTAATVEKLKAPQSGRVEYFDATFPAFGLRVSSSGRKSWIVFYRLHGKLRRYTIDTYPRKGLAEARKAASDILTKVEKGEDPVQEKKAAREAPSDRFGDVADQYLERDAKNNKGWQPIQNEIERELKPRWGDRPIHTIGKRDVLDLLDAKVDAGHPTAANRLLARIRRIFNWAVERGILEASPVQGIKAPAKETQRERVLSDNELQVLWEAAHRQGYPFGPLVQMLLTTAQRREEAAAMRWDTIQSGVWTIPESKSERPHEIPLPTLAQEVLEDCPRLSGPHVFSGRDGRRPYSGFSKAKDRLDGRIRDVAEEWGWEEVFREAWRLHDLRRTAATGMARLGVAPHVTEMVLNHITGQISGVAAVYNRYAYTEEKGQALEAWNRHLANLFRPAQTARPVGAEGPA